MVGPNKQFNKTEVLNKAMTVFWEKGYEATSMQDLVNSMGINRASMYQTYGNKYSLYLASIECYINNTSELITQVLLPPESSLLKLNKLFKIMVEHSIDNNQKGCLINNSAVELAPHDDTISKILSDFWIDMNLKFEVQIHQAIDDKEIADTTEPKQIAFLMNATLQGFMVLSKTNTSKQEIFNSIDNLFSLISQHN